MKRAKKLWIAWLWNEQYIHRKIIREEGKWGHWKGYYLGRGRIRGGIICNVQQFQVSNYSTRHLMYLRLPCSETIRQIEKLGNQWLERVGVKLSHDNMIFSREIICSSHFYNKALNFQLYLKNIVGTKQKMSLSRKKSYYHFPYIPRVIIQKLNATLFAFFLKHNEEK